MRQLGVLRTATQKRLLLALTAVTALATATPTASRERFQGLGFLPGFNESRANGVGRLFAIAALVFCCFAGAQALAQNAYITNLDANTVSVIDTTSNTVTAVIPVGSFPFGVAVSPDGSTVYVTDDKVSVIATASNTVTATIPGFSEPIAFGVFIGPPPVLATPPSGTACNGCSTAPSRAR